MGSFFLKKKEIEEAYDQAMGMFLSYGEKIARNRLKS